MDRVKNWYGLQLLIPQLNRSPATELRAAAGCLLPSYLLRPNGIANMQ
jgi:hypothetical protein